MPVPSSSLDKTKHKWRQRLVESRGEALKPLLALPLPLSLKGALAETAVIYFEANPGVLDQAKIRALAPHLPTPRLDALIAKQPPPPPTFPTDPDEQTVLDWFQAQYLLFRRWQVRHGDERARATAVESAQRFARWYLARYPKWLLHREQGWIAFQRSRLLSKASDALVLCVVLDGLPAWDAEDFARDLSARVERLHLLERRYCFAPFPTVTEFAKAALLRGDPPHLAQPNPPLAEVLLDRDDPAARLASCSPGTMRFWSLSQPDNAYHFEAEHKRAAKVRGELESLIERLRAVVERVPDEHTLQIVLTTDHGRLLNERAPCDKPVPSGMRAHGRAAWGSSGRRFPAEGFCVEDASGLCFAHGERFGVPEDVALVWDESAFQNDKRAGSEPYPHGGLFPEEAIVPWFVLERDAKPPEFKVEVTGAGESGGSGELRLAVTNLSRTALVCESVALSHAVGARAEPALRVPPLGATRRALRLAPWPSQADCATLVATLTFRLPNGKTITHKVKPVLEVKALYQRDESLLKELDL
ncbi:MAG: hypothetical protein NZ693_00355 [Thermoflexales bacterium]|nr:hypothetical protein [Thermoflexales bacterium]